MKYHHLNYLRTLSRGGRGTRAAVISRREKIANWHSASAISGALRAPVSSWV